MHDWPQDAIGQAIPYGIYDLTNNRGFVCIGDCFDTPRFAVEAVRDWWADDGSRRFPQAERLLILADAGGSNGCRSRVWKAQLQEQLCDACGLAVTVCHYPPGCSKWNPIEHRLFSAISVNWSGVPLRTLRDDRPLHRRHRHRRWTARGGAAQARRQRDGGARLGRRDAAAPLGAARRLPGVELHAVATNQLRR